MLQRSSMYSDDDIYPTWSWSHLKGGLQACIRFLQGSSLNASAGSPFSRGHYNWREAGIDWSFDGAAVKVGPHFSLSWEIFLAELVILF